MTTPRVSFILPIYNAGKTLRETLDSLFAQTFADFEIVAVNDGSTDVTAEILRSEHDPRLRIISRENRGLVASLNEAIDTARGELLARIDADDICLPDRLAKQVQFLDSNWHLAVAGSAIETFPNGGIVKYPENPAATLLFRSAVAHPSVMMRKSVLNARKLRYRDPFRCAQDYDLWCRCVASEIGIGNMPDVLLKYRLHAGQITHEFAEPTQLEGVVIRSQLLRDLQIGATEAQIVLHSAIARNQLVASEQFVEDGARWLMQLALLGFRRRTFERGDLMRVLTGRFVALCRFAREHSLKIPEKGIFEGTIYPEALD